MKIRRSLNQNGWYHIRLEKMIFGTYRLQDPNGKELAALVHGNRLLKGNFSSAETLKKLWASPAIKDQLRRRNITADYRGSDEPLNTALLERYLFEDDGDTNSEENQLTTTPTMTTANDLSHQQSQKSTKGSNLRPVRRVKPNLCPLVGREIFDNIEMEASPIKRRRKR